MRGATISLKIRRAAATSNSSPALRAASAASVQLSVPAIAALGAVLFLGEALELRVVLASVAILGGIALVVARR